LIPGNILETNRNIGYPECSRRRETPRDHTAGLAASVPARSLQVPPVRLFGNLVLPVERRRSSRKTSTTRKRETLSWGAILMIGLDEALGAQLLVGGVCPEAAGL
jgi:hypothetical protein